MNQSLQNYPNPGSVSDLNAEDIRNILLLIEQTRPEEIVSPSQLMQIGSYGFAQVRVAIAQCALSCVELKNKGSFTNLLAYQSEKRLTGNNIARLYIRYPYGVKNRQDSLPKTVKLEISSSHSFI